MALRKLCRTLVEPLFRNFELFASTLALLTGAVTTLYAGLWWKRRYSDCNPYSTKKWPLQSREVVTLDERRVWHWLFEAFEGHQILLKVLVTCFTGTTSKEVGRHWHPLLRGVYCTFAVCSAEGLVIGCVDVLKDTQRLPISHRQFRRALLARCSIAYMAVEADYLPSAEEIRLKFLGTLPPDIDISIQSETCLSTARRKLHEAVAQRRRTHFGINESLLPNGEIGTLYLAEEGQPERKVHLGDWQKYESFSVPLNKK